MFQKKGLEDIPVKGKKVLVRVDFNVPLEEGKVADDTRIRAALPTIEYLIEHQARVILTSHLGRPGGEKDQSLSLQPVAERLSDLLGKEVEFVPDCLGPKPEAAADNLAPGGIILLENTRFHAGEKANHREMAEELASLAEVFVNDAFGTAHRSHASNVGVAAYLPSCAGYLLEKEIRYLGESIADPERPFAAILGGAKVSGKIKVIKNLLTKADTVLIGGGMANTFFKAQGLQMADSLVEEDAVDTAKTLLNEAGEKLVLPKDVVIANDFSPQAQRGEMDLGDIPEGWRVMDIGQKTLEKYRQILKDSKTIVWNGPMGVFEFSRFAEGTFQLAKMIASSQAVSIIGGGDSAAAIEKAGLTEDITHVSTGGGASLAMLTGEELPGLAALDDK